ncbi:UNKNOWN [Stylonychia lemnae]|uniref:Uncharacterized protein n=1 Tax=Stylonychia lemnae TaxID=5949 RepID=A0A078B229_STYLE|nr:UNKNOWN [Stylonychia lemnae]|eukprot:CDW88605.1 UNKNOWN [Stylonychia lemnae]
METSAFHESFLTETQTNETLKAKHQRWKEQHESFDSNVIRSDTNISNVQMSPVSDVKSRDNSRMRTHLQRDQKPIQMSERMQRRNRNRITLHSLAKYKILVLNVQQNQTQVQLNGSQSKLKPILMTMTEQVGSIQGTAAGFNTSGMNSHSMYTSTLQQQDEQMSQIPVISNLSPDLSFENTDYKATSKLMGSNNLQLHNRFFALRRQRVLLKHTQNTQVQSPSISKNRFLPPAVRQNYLNATQILPRPERLIYSPNSNDGVKRVSGKFQILKITADAGGFQANIENQLGSTIDTASNQLKNFSRFSNRTNRESRGMSYVDRGYRNQPNIEESRPDSKQVIYCQGQSFDSKFTNDELPHHSPKYTPVNQNQPLTARQFDVDYASNYEKINQIMVDQHQHIIKVHNTSDQIESS